VFFGGGCKHGYDILAAGFLPASPFPQVLQLYWDSLFFFDLLTVALIFSHRRSGVLLAIAVMTTDVIANVYAEYLRQAPWLNNLVCDLCLRHCATAFEGRLASRCVNREKA
jgi:hypothetical protein